MVSFFLKTKRKPAEIKTDRYGRQLRCIPDKVFYGIYFVFVICVVVKQRGHTSVHLFRKDLRLHDNPALRSSLEGSGTFYPVYVLDTTAARHSKISANRWNFLLESLRDLDSQLARLGSRLFVVRGREVDVLPKLFTEWGVSRLSFETDSEPFGAQRDAVVRHLAKEAGVEVVSKTSHTLFEPGQILHANQGVAPMLFEELMRIVEEDMVAVPKPVKEVDRRLFGCCVTPVAVDHYANFGVPELNEVGVKDSRLVTSSSHWKGGEQEALRRLVLLERQVSDVSSGKETDALTCWCKLI